MTIAIGFKCLDGVLLCTDSLITTGDGGKDYESKLYVINAGASSYLAYAGYCDFARELVEALQVATKRLVGHELISAAKTLYRDFWKQKYSEPPKLEKTDAEILITAKVNQRIVLYHGLGRSFRPVDDYKPLGIGALLARQIFRPRFKKWMTMKQAVPLAIYGLRHIKNFGEGCGGDTRVRLIENSDTQFLPIPTMKQKDVTAIERDSEIFDEVVGSLFDGFFDPSVGASKFQVALSCANRQLQERKGYRAKEKTDDAKGEE